MLHDLEPGGGPGPEPSAPPAPGDLSERVLYTLLLPVVRLAPRLGASLRDLVDLLQMAYFHESRSRGMRLREIAPLLGVSMRKAAELSRRLKQNFLAAGEEVALPRRIEFLLWAQPLSRARIAQALPDVSYAALTGALEQLESEGRVSRFRRGRAELFARTRKNSRLVEATWESRLDGLANLLGTVASATWGRFFRDEQKALIRTISFYVRPEDLGELRRIYERLWDEVQRLESSAEGDPQALRMNFSVAYAPFGYLEPGGRR